jgi:peroxiredoxin
MDLLSKLRVVGNKLRFIAKPCKIIHMLAVGSAAPDFSLFTNPDQKIQLHQLRGRNVVLAFYPADWSPVCGDQMALRLRHTDNN